MDIVYAQPLKELLQVSAYFKEPLTVLVTNEKDEKVALANTITPCFLITQATSQEEYSKLSQKTKAVMGGSVSANELAVKLKAKYLLQPSSDKQFFDLGLAQKLADANITVVLMFEELLKANSFERHAVWKNYLEVVRYCKMKGTKFMVASGTKDPLLLRPPKSREALAVLLGLSKEQAAKYLE